MIRLLLGISASESCASADWARERTSVNPTAGALRWTSVPPFLAGDTICVVARLSVKGN